MSSTLFRTFILIYILLVTAAASVDALLPELLPRAIAQAVENEPLPMLFENVWLTAAIFIPLFMALIVSIIGLFFFRAWARMLAFYSTVLTFAVYPFFGPTLSSAWASALSDASSLLWGAILAVAYYSSLRERFTTNEKSSG